MSKEIQAKTKKVLACSVKSSERVYFRAFDTIGAIQKAGRKKSSRPEALESLCQISLNAYDPLRSHACNLLAEILTESDSELISFLETGLQTDRISYGCACGLLSVIGEKAYPKIVQLVLSSKLNENLGLDTRISALKALCRHCGQPFDQSLPPYFDETTEKDLPLKELRAWKKAGFPPFKPQEVSVPASELESLGIKLPQSLISFYKKHPRPCILETDNDQWSFYSPSQLLHKTKVDRKNYLYVTQLIGFGKTLRKLLDSDTTENEKGKPYSIDRLEGGVAIASNDSGDILFLDPTARNSVWAFFHDGGDVEKLASNFQAFLKKTEIVEA